MRVCINERMDGQMDREGQGEGKRKRKQENETKRTRLVQHVPATGRPSTPARRANRQRLPPATERSTTLPIGYIRKVPRVLVIRRQPVSQRPTSLVSLASLCVALY